MWNVHYVINRIELNYSCTMKKLSDKWFLLQTDADHFASPAELNNQLDWLPAIVPGTVAQSLLEANLWDIEGQHDFDHYDYWYRTTFDNTDKLKEDISQLEFKGLASISEVWLNGEKILSSKNMFISYLVDVTKYLQKSNELVLCFRALNKSLSDKHPRPRWKTKVINSQQLRWFRTTLLGRIPGWTPPITAVGPWRAISLITEPTPKNIRLKTSVNKNVGLVDFQCKISLTAVNLNTMTLTVGNTSKLLNVKKSDNGYLIDGELQVDNPILWWPHTHGNPNLYAASLSFDLEGRNVKYDLESIGFKSVELDRSDNGFKIKINNKPIFCRGACWTINDIVSLDGDFSSLKRTLLLMRDAGANMIRIGGTMVYEQDAFYRLCDELGIMVWQDFMFANMDYPFDDDTFYSEVELEIKQQLCRLSQYVSLSIYCGNSEIEQQASMLGMEQKTWTNTFFSKKLLNLCETYHPNIPYIFSTPTGGALPFHTNKGVTHYYGVGAYQRPVSELRQHDVQFTSECLGFANVPITKTRNQVLDGQLPVTHHPKWKERVPRDTGTGWDFEDVRDHYTKSLFNIDTTQTRCFDTERYLKLSEVASGEIMSQVFSEWRSSHSECSGGLVWFLKDFWSGAGWGIIDSNGLPKACYYYLKRCWQPINIGITNETLNGVDIHINNETSQELNGKIEISLLNKNSISIVNKTISIQVPKLETKTFNSDELLQNFYDTTYSYRFGPTKHSVVAVQLKNDNNELISEAYYFPNSEEPHNDANASLNVSANQLDDTTYELELSCNKFLYATCIEVDGYKPSDNFFHLLPDTVKRVTLKKMDPTTKRFKGYVSAINLTEDVKIKVTK